MEVLIFEIASETLSLERYYIAIATKFIPRTSWKTVESLTTYDILYF